MTGLLTDQYKASLSMLRKCVRKYDEKVWYDAKKYSNPAWQIAYHAVFFANYYCCASAEAVKNWKNECKEIENLAKSSKHSSKRISPARDYSQQEIINFIGHVSRQVPEYLKKFNAKKDCWPFWYNMNQLEFHLNNLRHIQHHTGQLLERQSTCKVTDIKWERF